MTLRKYFGIKNLMGSLTAVLMMASGHSAWADGKRKHRGLKINDHLTIKADLRYRHDTTQSTGSDPSHRHRIRGRVATHFLIDDFKLKFRLATGGTSIASTNQTLDDGFQTQPIGIDRAVFRWNPSFHPALKVMGGKMWNPFYRVGKSQLIWDNDVSPEGLAAKYVFDLGMFKPFARSGLFWVNDDSSGDTHLVGLQVGTALDVTENIGFSFGASYFGYSNVAGKTIGGTTFTEDFRLQEGWMLFGLRSFPVPVEVFFDLVSNLATTDSKTGWIAGLTIGGNDRPWKFRYTYRNLEANAALSIFTDSEFAGGGTDGKGHEFKVSYKINKNLKTGARYLLNTLGVSGTQNFHRLVLDFGVRI